MQTYFQIYNTLDEAAGESKRIKDIARNLNQRKTISINITLLSLIKEMVYRHRTYTWPSEPVNLSNFRNNWTVVKPNVLVPRRLVLVSSVKRTQLQSAPFGPKCR